MSHHTNTERACKKLAYEDKARTNEITIVFECDATHDDTFLRCDD